MPMPTTSPADMVVGSQASRVSSVMMGSPYFSGVAAASTYSQRGVITPTPNAKALGLMRCTFIRTPESKTLRDRCRRLFCHDCGPSDQRDGPRVVGQFRFLRHQISRPDVRYCSPS